MRNDLRFLLVCLVLILLVGTPGVAQAPPAPRVPNPDAPEFQPEPQIHRERAPEMSDVEKKQAKERAHQRYVALKRDTDRLLELSNELKKYVDRSNENVLSLEVIRKAEEIEKLAKSVREKMKGY